MLERIVSLVLSLVFPSDDDESRLLSGGIRKPLQICLEKTRNDS